MNIPLDQANGTDGNPVEVLVGKRLRMIRTNRGFSMRTLADRSGLNINTLSLIENGKTSPSVSTLQLLATALDVTLSSFFAQESPEKNVVYTPAPSVLLDAAAVAALFK